MSVVGFDIGNESCKVVVFRASGIDVALNDESKRETPAIVYFGDKQRFIGTAGVSSSVMNPKSSVSQIMRLIGLKFSDPVLQNDLKSLLFSVTEGPNGFPLIHTSYLGEKKIFTPIQVLSMIFSDLKSIAEKNLKMPVSDCCIGVPVFFTDLQRRAVLDAAKIAGLDPLCLFHETTATALGYGIYKTDLLGNGHTNVAFVDIGHANMQVCITRFKKGGLKILSHAFDQSLGGRDFDEALFQHFAVKFKAEHKFDVSQNSRASLRLRVECEKLKKVLSANTNAHLNIECLMDEKDVSGFLKREEFEKICVPVLQRIRQPLQKALDDAGIGVESIHAVEVVGSGSRVPAITKILAKFFHKEPRRTMNASESVARGCALRCAMLSPTFHVRKFQLNEILPFPIGLLCESTTESPSTAARNHGTVVFPKGSPIPSTWILTLSRSSTFSVDVVYTDIGDLQSQEKISTYTIGPFSPTKAGRAKVNVKVRLNLHGIVLVESATMLEEEEAEIPVTSKGDPMEEDVKSGLLQLGPVVNEAADVESQPEEQTTWTESDTKVKPTNMEEKKTNVPVLEQVHGALSSDELQKAVEEESKMALQDRVMEETKDKKNEVEAYVYDMRNKLHNIYREFVEESERKAFSSKLQEVEGWLYEEGEDETKEVYIAKLKELKMQGAPIEERYKENQEREIALERLVNFINRHRNTAVSNHPRLDHINTADKRKVVRECERAELWLKEKCLQQDALPKHANPVLLSSELKDRTTALDRFCRAIMKKPKQSPKKVQTPSPQKSETGRQQQAAVIVDRNSGSNADSPSVTQPIDTDELKQLSSPPSA